MSSENDELMKQRQQLEGILDVGTGDFITDMRTELESLCKANTSLIRAAMTECSDGKFSRKLGEYTNTLTKLMSALDSVTGLKEKVSLDTAIDTVTRAGYEINQTEKATDSKSDNKVNVTPERFKEFKAWERNNGKA
ncbi:MAG: hypothetical protein KME22_09340 [Hassallia sp. WJT32-NPBG1]|nr:hypothetical protein [Hassallia sp. WJT32-NPBG1]